MLRAALRGDTAAADALVRALADMVWTGCRRVTCDTADAEEAFGEVIASLRADDFARLKGYDGRTALTIYAGLVVRDLLSERTIRLLAVDATRGWRAFEAFFGPDIRRMVTRMLPGTKHQQNREDGYQAVCEALVRDDFQRLRAYSGRGSPSGFVLHTIENLIIDFVRTIIPRRRLPAAIERLSDRDQAIFRLIYWDGHPPDAVVIVQRIVRPGEPGPTQAEVAEAIDRVREALPRGYYLEPRGDAQTTSLSAVEDIVVASGAEDFAVRTPEQELVDREGDGLLEQALDALRQVLPKLASGEQLYLQLAMAGQPAREIARIVGCPVEDIHRLAQKVKRRLRQEIGEDIAVKNWRLSV